MRRVGLSDLDRAARVVATRPEDKQAGFALSLIESAHAADKWRKRHQSAHPSGGTGSLFAQASLHDTLPSSGCDPRYCQALSHVLRALERWRGRIHHEA